MSDDDKDDAALFRAAMKDTKPLKRRGRPLAAPAATRPAAARQPPAPPPVATPPAAVAPLLDPVSATGLDRGTADRLRRGKLEPDARLDLHGLTLAQAERALARFLERAQASGCKVVLIITGKGQRGDDGRIGEGRIRAEFPHWLNRPENRACVHGVRAAHVRHGGGGAF
jgi:DNA-nicking Smr family endonuclease